MTNPWNPEEKDRERWQREAQFFDEENHLEDAFSDLVVERYRRLSKPWLPAEFPFHILGDVRGKKILEVGSGDGSNALLLGLRGAEVLGLDISPRAVAAATIRAEKQGISDRVKFLCMPLELFVQSNTERYDIICGFAILHHLLPVLDPFLASLKQLAQPTTRFLFVEPVSLWKFLRQIRLMLPIPVYGTPDERPIEPSDIAIIDRHIPGLRAHYYGAALRLVGRMVKDYERDPAWVRTLHDGAACFDNVLLAVPGLQGLGSAIILYTPGPS